MAQLHKDGWSFLNESFVSMNQRTYSVVKMIRDGKICTINSRGGFNGLSTSLAKQ